MTRTTPEQNKALVLEAFDTLFNKRDYATAERFWSSNYVQHSAHIEPGREGLFNLIKGSPAFLKYEPGVIVADGDFVIVHGRFSGTGRPRGWIAADVVRMDSITFASSRSASSGLSGRARPSISIESTSGPRSVVMRRAASSRAWKSLVVSL